MKDQDKSLMNQLEATPAKLSDDRREFLKKCKDLTIYTAPAIAALLLFDNKKGIAFS